MATALDTQQRFGQLTFDNMAQYSAQSTSPHFSNPWNASSSSPHNQGHGLYAVNSQGLTPSLNVPRHVARTSTSSNASSLSSFGPLPSSAAPAGSSLAPNVHRHQDLLNVPQDLLSLNRLQTTSAAYGDPVYATAASPVHASYAPSPAPYETMGYAPAPMRSTFALAPETEHSRRFSHTSVPSISLLDTTQSSLAWPQRNSPVDPKCRGLPADDRRGFADALDASHGMLAMSQETPRNIYGNRSDRGSADSYGFPSAHSTSSSISSTGNYSNSYYGDSVSDYSTAGSDIESIPPRTLPRPTSLMANQPPAPQSMMGQFSSKVSSSTQKKHKCKVCDKRFTRPSSLQTHMYSHTGEKRKPAGVPIHLTALC
jgi:hypothetical protein